MARARKKVTKDNSNAEFFEALRLMEEERGIPQQFIAEKIADAIVVAARKDYGGDDIVSCVIDTEKTVNITNDKKIYLNFVESGIERLPVKLYKIGERTDKETVVIFSCDEMNENLSDFRIEKVQIVTDE